MSILFGSGHPENSWLHNWSGEWPVRIEGMEFKTTEHLYQALKFLDVAQQSRVICATSAYLAKKNGRLGVLRPDWEDIKIETMYCCVLLKAYQNIGFIHKLMNTAGHITEMSHDDKFWGIVISHEIPSGNNHMGLILMRIRDYAWRLLNGEEFFDIPPIANKLTVMNIPLARGFYQI